MSFKFSFLPDQSKSGPLYLLFLFFPVACFHYDVALSRDSFIPSDNCMSTVLRHPRNGSIRCGQVYALAFLSFPLELNPDLFPIITLRLLALHPRVLLFLVA